MKQNDIKVSILLATYNSEKYIRTQLDSIINQTHSNWELIISDDSSKDKTIEILKEYKSNYPEKICILNNDHSFGNARDNFFNLLKNSSGSYIMFCDHDDKWLPEKIELTLSEMLKTEASCSPHTPVLVHTDLKVVDEKLNVIAPSLMQFENILPQRTDLNYLLIQNVITGCTVMINHELADIGLMAENYSNVLMHDWWLGISASAFGVISYVNEPTILYRQHGNNSVGAKNTKNIHYIYDKIVKNRDIKESLIKTTVQAGEFFRTYSQQLSPKKFTLVREYSNLYKKDKFKRIVTMCKYNFFKYGFSRKIAQIIWG